MTEWIFSASILIVLIIGLRVLLKGKINLRMQYALWLVVLLRLLFPFSIGNSAFSVTNAIPASSRMEAVLPMETHPIPVPIMPQEQLSEPTAPLSPPESQPEARPTLSYRHFFTVIRLAGIALTGLTLIGSNLYFHYQLQRTRQRFTQMRCSLPIFLSPAVDTPCLFGLIHPAIYLPPDLIENEQELRYVLAHERTHFLHGDHVWALLRGVCLTLHWYNPLVWWAASLSRRDAELACDEATIHRLGESQRVAYGRTLLRMTCEKRPSLLVTATTMTGSRKSIRERIEYIAHQPHMAAYTVAALLVVLLLVIGCTFTGQKISTPVSKLSVLTQKEIPTTECFYDTAETTPLSEEEQNQLISLLQGLHPSDFSPAKESQIPVTGIQLVTTDWAFTLSTVSVPGKENPHHIQLSDNTDCWLIQDSALYSFLQEHLSAEDTGTFRASDSSPAIPDLSVLQSGTVTGKVVAPGIPGSGMVLNEPEISTLCQQLMALSADAFAAPQKAQLQKDASSVVLSNGETQLRLVARVDLNQTELQIQDVSWLLEDADLTKHVNLLVFTMTAPVAEHLTYVPDFSGVSLEEAQRNSLIQGFQINIQYDFSRSAPADTFLSQHLPPNTALPAGEPLIITLSYSRGPLQIRDLQGKLLRWYPSSSETEYDPICLTYEPMRISVEGGDLRYLVLPNQDAAQKALETVLEHAQLDATHPPKQPALGLAVTFTLTHEQKEQLHTYRDQCQLSLLEDGSLYSPVYGVIPADYAKPLFDLVIDTAKTFTNWNPPVKPEQLHGLVSATLDNNNSDPPVTLTDKDSLAQLESWLTNSKEVGYATKCWFTSYLTLKTESGASHTIALATDDCGIWRADGAYYAYADHNKKLFNLFRPSNVSGSGTEPETDGSVDAAFMAFLNGDRSLLAPGQSDLWYIPDFQDDFLEYEFTRLDLDGDGVAELLVQLKEDPQGYNGVFHFEQGQIFCWNSDSMEMNIWDYPLQDGTMVRQAETNGTCSYTLYRYQSNGQNQEQQSLFAREEVLDPFSTAPVPYYEASHKEVDKAEFDKQLKAQISHQLLPRSAWSAV